MNSSAIENVLGSIVQWRLLGQFVAWPALLMLILAGNAEEPESMVSTVLPWLALAGILSLAVNLLWSQASNREFVELNVAAWITVVAGLLALRQLLVFARRGASLNIEQLWRLIGLQWALLAAGAEVYFRWNYRHDGVAANENARSLLFLLPALAVLPNVLMAVGIRLWAAGQTAAQKSRPRAWLMAMFLLNVGILFSLIRPSFLFFIGVPLILLSMMLYFAGFPGTAFRSAFVMTPVSLLLFAAGLILLYLERVKIASGQDPPSRFYDETWQQLIASSFSVWLMSAGYYAVTVFLPAKIRPRVAGQIAVLLFVGGSVITAAILFGAAFDRDILQGLLVGTGMQLFALLIAVAALLRSARFLRPAAEVGA